MKFISRLGQIVFYIGLAMSVIGLVVGFWHMFQDNDETAKLFLLGVPTGFMLLFTGLATSVMFSPRDESSLNKKRSHGLQRRDER